MTVSELIEALKKFPPDAQCTTRMCSDFIDLDYPVLTRLIHNPSNEYYAKYYPHQHEEEPTGLTHCVYFDGN